MAHTTRKIRITVAAAAIAAGLASAAALSAARAETLAEALATAVSNSPDLDVQRAALRGLDEAVAQARAGMRPTLTGSGSAGLTYTDNSALAKSTTRAPLSVGANVTQPIYDGGQTANAVDGAFATVKSGRFTLLDTEQAVLLNALTAYAQVIAALENVDLAQNNLTVNQRTLQAARDRFEVGEVTRTDVAQAEAAVAEAQANLSIQRGLLGQRRQDYVRFVGIAPGDLKPLPPLPALPASFAEAQAVAEQNHPAVQAAKSDVDAASFGVREAIGATLPQVDVTANVSLDSNVAGNVDTNDTLSAGGALRVTVPIYQGGALRSRVRQAQAGASQSRAQLTLTTRQVLQQVGVAWENLSAARSTIRANEAQVRAQRVAVAGVREEVNVGTRTTLDLLEAQRDLLNAEVALVGSQTNLYVNAYTLMSAIGVLTIAKLGLDVEGYDPEPAYRSAQEFGATWTDTEDTNWRSDWRP